ncbi:MAG: C-terminal binding protein [Actinobacteria bacterium]|nr:C-terminal binding protein [Actinomycetota bacterium]
MPTVLKTDAALVPFDEPQRDLLADRGLELIERPCATEEELIEYGRGVDALMVVAEPVTARVISELDGLRVITRFGAGLDNLDVEAAARAGVQVTYVPGASVEEVSDHTIAMIFSLARGLPVLDASVRAGGWAIPAEVPPLRRLRGQTLGIVGVGRIGRAVARKARALGLEAVAFDPYASPASLAEAGIETLPLDDLLARADHVSVHTPLTPETRHLIGAREIALMKPTATLVNVARGGVVDQAALAEALASGHLRGAGIDVQEEEPPPADEPLRRLPNVILTPHAAHYSQESMDDLRRSAIEDVAAVLDGRAPRFPVNEAAAA